VPWRLFELGAHDASAGEHRACSLNLLPPPHPRSDWVGQLASAGGLDRLDAIPLAASWRT
jgi:hypothetical protein